MKMIHLCSQLHLSPYIRVVNYIIKVQYDFINELGYLALATRLKRMSDAMIHSGRQMYKELGIDIEPNWFLIFKLLKKYERLSVTEIATKLHFSHPSVITMLNKMEANGYLNSANDEVDSRKRYYTLSKKAFQKLPDLEAVWEAGTKGVADLFPAGSDFMAQIEALEIKLSEADFRQRTLNELTKDEQSVTRS